MIQLLLQNVALNHTLHLKKLHCRLYASPTYKVNENSIGLPKIVTEFQRSNIEEIINKRLCNSCHLEECNEGNDNPESCGTLLLS